MPKQLFLLVAVAFIAQEIVCTPAFTGGFNQGPLSHQTFKFNETQPQLQPENHDNLRHGIPHFFQHEIHYVENDQVLVWKPRSGEWAVHRLLRDCGVDCAMFAERPLSHGVWPHFIFHKFVFMGCHASTGAGHMLVVNPAGGNYTVYKFDTSQSDPMTELLARHQRLEMTEFDIVYTGKDEIVMHDGNTGQFKVFLVEPRLPMSGDEDPIGPFEPLVEGKFDLYEQVLYLGHNHLFDYSAVTGHYRLVRYSRGATLSETPFALGAGEGIIDKGLQLTYLGENQILAFNPATGKFKAFAIKSISDDKDNGDIVINTQTTKEGPYFGFGSVITGDICASEISCGSCIAKDGCGWCATSELCYRGSLEGPCVTNCTTWELHLCPGEPCHMHRGCTTCLTDPFCGWCSDLESCVEGTHGGPLFGSCEYSKIACPVHVETVTEEHHCSEEIQ